MYQNGVDIRTLQSILGHSSVDTTMIYTHIENENMREAAARIRWRKSGRTVSVCL